ncbi:L domain-like protein, partial [Neocallimastix californiae]
MKIKYNFILHLVGIYTAFAQNQCDIMKKALEEMTSTVIDFKNDQAKKLHCCGVDYIGCKGDGTIINVEIDGKKILIEKNIPESITQLTGIERLALINNNNTEISFPDFLGKLPKLDTFEIRDSRVNSNIPENIGELKSLKSLVLVNDNISGSIPENIGSLTNLNSLYLEGNVLSGGIPESIGDLINLRSLDLKNNKLNGAIPLEITKLKKLESLELSGNELTDEIPEDIGNLVKLRVLDLGNNKLSGSIPESVTELKKLENLYLSYNSFYGTVDFGNNLPSLKKIELINSGLFGVLPNFSKNVTECSFSESDICVESKPDCTTMDSPCTEELYKKVKEFNEEEQKLKKEKKKAQNRYSSSKIITSLLIIAIPLIGIVVFLHVYKWYNVKKEDELVIKKIDHINNRISYYNSDILVKDVNSDAGSDANMLITRVPDHRKLNNQNSTRSIFDDDIDNDKNFNNNNNINNINNNSFNAINNVNNSGFINISNINNNNNQNINNMNNINNFSEQELERMENELIQRAINNSLKDMDHNI